MHISFLIFYIPMLLLFSCGQKEKNSDSQGSKPPPVCEAAAENVIVALKGQSLANLDNSLTQKVDLNCVSKDGISPLNTAVVLGGEANLEKILEKGAEPNFKNALGETALHQAVKSGKKHLMRSLFDHYKVDFYKKGGGEVNLGNIGDNSGKTPLHLAIQLGDLNATEFLLEEKRVDLERVDKQRWTALHYAANEANPIIIKYLLNHGANRGAKNRLGHTPFFTCQRSPKVKSYEVCQELKSP